MKRVLMLAVALFGVIALAGGALTASAVSPFSLFGSATLVPGGVQLTSDATASPPVFSGIAYTVPAGTTLGQITNLGTDYKFTSASCANGSPRFSIETASGNVFVYIGPPPNYTNCPTGQQSTGNLLSPGPTHFCDTSQFGSPGTFYGSCDFATGPFAGLAVTGIALVSDNGPGSGGLGSQTLIVNNVNVNGAVFSVVGPPTSKDQCKNGGWQSFNNPAFKNQGDCVSFVATHGRNPGNG